MADRSVVLRSDDPRLADLEAAGWRCSALSWGASLDSTAIDLVRLAGIVLDAAQSGVTFREVRLRDIAKVLVLDANTAADYPGGVATSHTSLTRKTATPSPSRRGFAAFGSSETLLAVTYVDLAESCGSIDFTTVDRAYRRQGIATALKAAALLALAADGIACFRTGGSSDNLAIIRANATLGFHRDEEWLTLNPPGASNQLV